MGGDVDVVGGKVAKQHLLPNDVIAIVMFCFVFSSLSILFFYYVAQQ